MATPFAVMLSGPTLGHNDCRMVMLLTRRLFNGLLACQSPRKDADG